MIKQISSFLLILMLSLACKEEKAKKTDVRKEKKTKTHSGKKEEVKNNVEINKPFSIEGDWYCFQFEPNMAVKHVFSPKYAEEFTRYAHFRIHSDSLFLTNNLGQPIYTYYQSGKKKGFGVERQLFQHVNLNADSIQFLAQYNGLNKFEPFTLLARKGNNLVLYDRGYYFHFKKGDKKPRPNIKIVGCPGDTRNYFSVVQNIGFQNIPKAYQQFKKDFPGAAEGLAEELPKENFEGFIEEVSYSVKSEVVKIEKRDPQGTVKIEFREIKVGMKMYYEIEYLEY